MMPSALMNRHKPLSKILHFSLSIFDINFVTFVEFARPFQLHEESDRSPKQMLIPNPVLLLRAQEFNNSENLRASYR